LTFKHLIGNLRHLHGLLYTFSLPKVIFTESDLQKLSHQFIYEPLKDPLNFRVVGSNCGIVAEPVPWLLRVPVVVDFLDMLGFIMRRFVDCPENV
jgi:hypothetical protein